MFKFKFISEENSNIYYAQNGAFAVKELPEMKEEDGFEVYIDGDEYLDLNEYLSEGDDAEKVINWSTELILIPKSSQLVVKLKRNTKTGVIPLMYMILNKP